ncbi:MAG: UTP--glucose-1-phosphate uridylyltransferase [Verrucomicrobiales bacterium]
MSRLVEIIRSSDPSLRNTPLEGAVAGLSRVEIEAEAAALDEFRRHSPSLYERVRACIFLYALHRFHLPSKLASEENQRSDGYLVTGIIPAAGHAHLLERRFAEAIGEFLAAAQNDGLTEALCSAMAQSYYRLGLQNLADQVRSSVRSVRGNQWMFRCGSAHEHPLRVCAELRRLSDGAFPVLHEKTAVRMDLTHSGWSDIFFLGMDFPEAARVLNVSIDLAVRGRDEVPAPPVEAMLRVIDSPVLRLTSVDLGASAEITDLVEVFDFARDHLGLLKAAVIAGGLVPIGMEGSGESLAAVLERMLGRGLGLEIVSQVNGIPKGSRLAVSTNLLGCLISVCMRASGQTRHLTGQLSENERRVVAARAILGEWLGGSGGGWQDSGGVWPGIKTIEGCVAGEGDPEFGVSRGTLLPRHLLLGENVVPAAARRALEQSLILVHGGLAQNVGPILEMVTEKYLLRSSAEWTARAESLALFDQILDALRAGDVRRLGGLTTRHFFGPLQTIVPWCTTFFTERLIAAMRQRFGEDFWGFWMLGGMSGGGMGFMFSPDHREAGAAELARIMLEEKESLQHSLPFAMDPVVYDFSINEIGTTAAMLENADALLVPGYYAQTMPRLLREDPRNLSAARRREIELFSQAARETVRYQSAVTALIGNLLPAEAGRSSSHDDLDRLLAENGFDALAHEQIRANLRAGHIGLAQNRLPASTRVENVFPEEVPIAPGHLTAEDRLCGETALRNGEVAVVTLAAGAASRWTGGAGVVKALHPFCKLGGRHRTFLEVHFAKTRRTALKFTDRARDARAQSGPLHAVTTSYLTHEPIRSRLEAAAYYGLDGQVFVSQGRSIGLRLVPMARDLRFYWEETAQQLLDERQEKVRASLRQALLAWAESAGEGSDYRDNTALQCLHPVGHWFEVPNLLLNGTLHSMIHRRPQLKTLLMHNIDTLGASLDPALLGFHRRAGVSLTFELIGRRIEDRGGGLARVNDKLRLVEGLALARETDEFKLSYYNTLSNWIDVDRLLEAFGLARADLGELDRVAEAVRDFSKRLPTYITLKDVKKRWGHGQEDVFPVAQFEKLWGDMTALSNITSNFVEVPRFRGQQLKEQSQLDGWLREGGLDYVEQLCAW